MAGIQASGVGSGLDIASLVSQLVAAERAPHDARLARSESSTTLEISALGALKGSIGALRDALVSLKSLASFAARSATSADSSIFTASATAEVLPGTYDIEVVSLASAQKLVSGPFVDGREAVVGWGTLTVSLGSDSFDVQIAEDADSLVDIRDAINNAAGNPGVTASILNETGGSRLVLTSRATGAANTIEVAQSGGDGGLAAIVYDPDTPLSNGLEEKSPAADALIRVNGYDYQSATDTVTGAVDGLTINLKKADDGAVYSLKVANDTGTVGARIRKFVTDFNALAKVFRDLQRYDATSGKAGALIGDAYVRGLENQVRRDITDAVTSASGTYGSLAEIGIRTQADGTLKIDDTVLNAALEKDFDSVSSLFAGDDGAAARLHSRLDDALGSTAQLSLRTESLNLRIKDIAKNRADVDQRMSSVRARYLAQFTALDQLLAKMQSTGNYLNQQLSALSKSTG